MYSIKYKNISIDVSLASHRKVLYTRKVHWKMSCPVKYLVRVRSHSDQLVLELCRLAFILV